MYKSILVTGGAGFAGSALSIALANTFQGVEIIALDNLKRRGSERNLDRLARNGVKFIHGDIRNLSDLLSVSPSPELIIECSAEPSVQAGYGTSPEYLVNTNLTGCFHCLELARRVRADFIFISTSRVYPYALLNDLPFIETETRFAWKAGANVTGLTESGISEDFPLHGARSLYGMTKLAGELLVQEFAEAYGFRFVINRFGLLTGPHQMAKSDQGVIALWVAAHYFNRPLSYIGFGGSGKQVRDLLHVDDFCDLIIDQIRNFDLYSGTVWNAGGGLDNSLSLMETTHLCKQIVGRDLRIAQIADNRPADVRIFLTDSKRVSAVSGWTPKRDRAQTLTDIARWLGTEGSDLERVIFS